MDVCDALDNDCDGMIDEILNSPRSRCRGVLSGMRQCENGEYSPGGEVPATDEICDNLDNDCDGMADESLPKCVGAILARARSVRVYAGGVFGSCIGGVKRQTDLMASMCCDERVDEDTTEVCGSDRGECTQGARTSKTVSYGLCRGNTAVRGAL